MTLLEEVPAEHASPLKRAVLYLRVSTVSQVRTDYDPEGISIPAQREACLRKAAQMGVEVVEEYVEPGKTATSMDKRPAFQAMLQRLRSERDIDYVLVYKLSRMNRNRVDDAKVLMLLRALKVTLVSATESIDETPVGQLMHGILASFNEFRSAEDGADIRYKMAQKAKRGGTLGKAPLGYLNVRERFEGREVRTVALDPERAPLVREAFELYSEGDLTLERLQAALTDRGLTTRPTNRWPAGQVSINKLHQMLSDPYYKGVIEWQGELYPGRHEPLCSPELFARVQEVLAARSGKGQRDRVHHHYLRGFLFCDRCHRQGRQSRMLFTYGRGRSGDRWAYFFCRGRQQGLCDLPFLPVAHVEQAVLRYYAALELPPHFAADVRTRVTALMDDRLLAAKNLRRQLDAELQQLDTREERLLDLAMDSELPQVKIKTRLASIREERARLQRELGKADDQLDVGRDVLEAGLDLIANPQELYRQAPDETRRHLNETFWERLYVDDEGVVDGDLNTPFDELLHARSTYFRPSGSSTTNKRPSTDAEALVGTGVGLLAAGLSVGGSSKTALVEVEGIEPSSSGPE